VAEVDGAGAGEAAHIEPPREWARFYARGAAYGIYAMTLVCGFALGASDNHALQVLTAFGVAWSLAFFCALDARAHQKVFVHAFWWLTFLGWPVAPLFHLVRVRGKRGALTYVLHALLLLFCVLTSAGIGSLIKPAR
jgi:hypothetical protein